MRRFFIIALIRSIKAFLKQTLLYATQLALTFIKLSLGFNPKDTIVFYFYPVCGISISLEVKIDAATFWFWYKKQATRGCL
ncbi:hypothetical protein D0N37_04490 [Pseudoalteromonas piscicida]|nr:hypothetical protein D0N37_04490 [Pseudoalteromonas piscicida]